MENAFILLLKCKDLFAMVNKYKQRKKRNFKSIWKSNKDLNSLMKRNSNTCQEQEKEEDRKGPPTFQGIVDFGWRK